MPRLLRLLHALFERLEALGCTITVHPRESHNGFVMLHVGDTTVQFRAREKLRRRQIEGSGIFDGQVLSENHPTGELELTIESFCRLPRRRWKDSKRRKLEEQLPSVILGLAHAAVAEALHDEELRHKEQAWNRERELRELATKRRHLARHLAADLAQRAEQHTSFVALAAFLNDERTPLLAERCPTWATWLEWAHSHLKQLESSLFGDDVELLQALETLVDAGVVNGASWADWMPGESDHQRE